MAVRFLVWVLVVAGCGGEKLIESVCQTDVQCPTGQLCEKGLCVAAETKRCEVVLEGKPLLQPSPYAVDFGEVDVGSASRTVSMHSIGTCTLTVFEAQLARAPESPFGCDLCAVQFPIEIFPGRRRDFSLSFKAGQVGLLQDELRILSDDKEFPELRVPIRAHFLGIPELRVAPSPIDFGYLAKGRAQTKVIQLTNRGTGTAKLNITKVALSPEETQDFSLVSVPELPLALGPVTPDALALGQLEVKYHPRTQAQHTAELVLTTHQGERRIAITGNAATPPKLSHSPDVIQLGRVAIGQTNVAPLMLQNEGGAPLEVQYLFGGPKPSTDLYAAPKTLPKIPAGGYVELQVAFTATAVGPVSGLLVLTTTDPTRPSITVPVFAEGVAGTGASALKVEMSFENGAETAFDNDLRNVDLMLEHPLGYVCNSDYPKESWGEFGNATWIAFGPKEEPERLVLTDATKDGTYKVRLQYVEDCSSLPTELAAGLLGISVDVLIGYLTGGAAQVDGEQVADVVQKVCVNRSASLVTVRAYVDGTLKLEKSVALSKKGEATTALEVVRSSKGLEVR